MVVCKICMYAVFSELKQRLQIMYIANAILFSIKEFLQEVTGTKEGAHVRRVVMQCACD